MIPQTRFSRDLYLDTLKQFKDKTVRRQKVAALYKKFDVEEVRFNGSLIGWTVAGKFVCYKRTFNSEADAKLVVGMGRMRGWKVDQVYECPKCGLWHTTSKGHMVGKYNSK